jgi:GH35 family endo-1,4-beta-xylanase
LAELRANFQRVAAVGVPIYISEYDIDVGDDAAQERIMSQQFPLFYESPEVVGVTLWGYIYGQTWRENTGLQRDGQPRPAMTWLMNYLQR